MKTSNFETSVPPLQFINPQICVGWPSLVKKHHINSANLETLPERESYFADTWDHLPSVFYVADDIWAASCAKLKLQPDPYDI